MVELNSLREPSNDNISCTHLPDLLNGRGEYVEDDHPLLKRRLIRHFHQDHIGVNHQEAQVEELVEEAKRGQSSLNVLHTRDSCLYVLHYDEEKCWTEQQREELPHRQTTRGDSRAFAALSARGSAGRPG